MRRKLYALLTATLVSATFFAAAQNKANVDVKGFVGVDNSISANVNIYQSSDYKVEVIAPQSVIDDLNIFVEDGMLRLKKKDSFFNWSTSDDKVVVNVWSPSYNALTLNGSGNIVAKTPISTKDFSIRINGSGDVNVESLEAQSISVKSNGSGDVFVAGSKSVEIAEYSINGSGDIDAYQISTKKASAQINGSGDIKVWATVEFSTRIVGSGDVEVKGNPSIDAKVLGSGSLKRQ